MNKKSILFTIATVFLLSAIFLLSIAYLEYNKQSRSTINLISFGDKLNFIEDDIISNIYSELLEIELDSITRTSTVNVNFSQLLLDNGKNYNIKMNNYRDFIVETYDALYNIDINLTQFNNNFTLEPYDTLFELQDQILFIYTIPESTNYVQSITLYAKIDKQFSIDGNPPEEPSDGDDACEAPGNDQAGYPIITVTWEDSNGYICSRSRRLDPEEDNDKGNNRQFYVEFLPSGSAHIKYGQISGKAGDGIFVFYSDNINANITHLDIGYTLTSDKIKLKGGNLTIVSGLESITKQTPIILLEE